VGWEGIREVLAIANGSLRELETHFVVAQRLGYLTEGSSAPLFQAIDELARMIYTLRKKVSGRLTTPAA
jgi:four helix bundle protein